jgi:hypothetical protein
MMMMMRMRMRMAGVVVVVVEDDEHGWVSFLCGSHGHIPELPVV